MKFPHRLPILPESHEVLVYDVTRSNCCRPGDLPVQARDLQAAMAAAAGYFGGYTSKMQDIGEKEVRRLSATLTRKLAGEEKHESEAQAFQYYSRRLVRDLEAKGIVRTALESTQLSLHADHPDALMAECIRTFPTVTFPASLLLKREEVETLKTPGASIIAAVFHGHGRKNAMFTEAPFDLMYGFRGTTHNVDLLSPYETLLHWSLERIGAPTSAEKLLRATWTKEGLEYKKQCVAEKIRPQYHPGVHYVAVEGKSRILMPHLAALGNLRHCWCWERRKRLHIPTWSFTKVPRSGFSPEENARLLSVYMRPWTVISRDASTSNPLLSMLGKCCKVEGKGVPFWRRDERCVPASALHASSAHDATGGRLAAGTSSTHVPPADDSELPVQSPKRRRVGKQSVYSMEDSALAYYSYACSWETYVGGHVVSEPSRRYITNLLAATASARIDEQQDSSDDSDEDQWKTAPTQNVTMGFVRRALNGIAAHSAEDGSRGFGRHASVIRMGRALWQTPPLDSCQERGITERFFDDGSLPPCEESKKSFAAAKKVQEMRPAPFQGKTMPHCGLSVIDYGQRMEDWFAALQKESAKPAEEDAEIIRSVMRRVLDEFRLEKEGCDLPKAHADRQEREEPMRGFIHGPPGTGKSRLIYWIRRLFTEALGWEHGVQFLCVAFQNRVAHAMGGVTCHTGADVGVGCGDKASHHTDVDVLFTRNQDLRWLLFDEIGMIRDTLLGYFEKHITDAAKVCRYLRRVDKSQRPFGGYNLLAFGDLFQIPPIPASSSLCIPPKDGKTAVEQTALALFWGDGASDSFNFFRELTEQKRVLDDPWYSALLEECRFGRLSEESYHFLLGLPTEHAGSWPFFEQAGCQTERCRSLQKVWAERKKEGEAWGTLHEMECDICQAERERRNRLILPEDPRVVRQPFVSAPYMHKNNEPKYHAMLLRAAEHAKQQRQHVLWFHAEDTPDNPAQVAKSPQKLKERLERLLQLHDQKTAGIPGLTPMYENLQGRVTEKICMTKAFTILKHQSCTLVGWELHPGDRRNLAGCERLLSYLPRCLYLRVEGASWVIHSRLGPGVFPLFPVTRTWELNAATGAKIRRKGFTFLPDYASTAFMIQGATLPAGLADCGDVLDTIGSSEAMTAYVILSRLTSASGLLLLRAFSPELFGLGAAPAPSCLLDHMRRRFQGTDNSHAVQEARKEYDVLVARQDLGRQKRKQLGPSWHCWHCRQKHPVENFGADRQKSNEVYALCVEPGHWRCCTACRDALDEYMAKKPTASGASEQTCST